MGPSWAFVPNIGMKKDRSPDKDPGQVVVSSYSSSSRLLVCLANILGPKTAHLLSGYFITNPHTLRERLCFRVRRYTRMVHEYRFASIGWLDESVTLLAFKPTFDNPGFSK